MRQVVVDVSNQRLRRVDGWAVLSVLISYNDRGFAFDPARMQAEHVYAVHKFRESGDGQRRGDETGNLETYRTAAASLSQRFNVLVSDAWRLLMSEDSEAFLNVNNFLPSLSTGLRGAANWNFESGASKKFKEVFHFETDETAKGMRGDAVSHGKVLSPLPMVLSFSEWQKSERGGDSGGSRFRLVQREAKSTATSLADAIADSVAGIPPEAAAILVSNLCAENCEMARDILNEVLPSSTGGDSSKDTNMKGAVSSNSISSLTSMVDCLRYLSSKRSQLITSAIDNAVGMAFSIDEDYAAYIDEAVNETFFTKPLASTQVPPPPNLAQFGITGTERTQAIKEFKLKWPEVIREVAQWEREWLKSCGYEQVFEMGNTRTFTFNPFAMQGSLRSRIAALEDKVKSMQATDWNRLSESQIANVCLARAASYILLKDVRHCMSAAATEALTKDLIVKNAKDVSACANAFAHLLCDIGYGQQIFSLVASCYDVNLIVFDDAKSATLFPARTDIDTRPLAMVSRFDKDKGFAAIRLHTGGADLVTAPMTKVTLKSMKQAGFELPTRATKPKWMSSQTQNSNLPRMSNFDLSSFL